MNRLINKRMSNIYSNSCCWENWRSKNFDFPNLKNSSRSQSLVSYADTNEFYNLLQLKNQRSRARACRSCVCVCVCVRGGGGGEGGVTPPPFFWSLLVFWQNVSVKLPDPMLPVNLEYFIIKNEMQNSINIQSRRNQTFTGNDGF